MNAIIITAFSSCHKEKEKPTNLEELGFKPNILWITCEDISPNIAPYGDSAAHTLTINRLAN